MGFHLKATGLQNGLIDDETNLIKSDLSSSICTHESKEIRRRDRLGALTHFAEQCCSCGAYLKTISTKELWKYPGLPSQMKKSDEEAFEKNQTERFSSLQAIAERRGIDWWHKYQTYLASQEWRAIRKKALKRDSGLCQGCRVNRATQVHHLTYERVGNEMIFDLISVCDTCHKAIHRNSGEEP